MKTKIFTLVLCCVAILISLLVQLSGYNLISEGCSYLDPILIDVLAFSVGIFLVLDGLYRISEHKNMALRNQFTRSIRVAIGFAIITIHIMQFIHKFL